MSFISLEFVLLFLLCFTSYHFVSDKRRKFVLLAASGVFIGYFNPAFLVTALVVSLFTYGAAILIEQAREKGRGSRLIYWGGIFCLVLCWMGFRYANRLTGNSGFIFPLGMSFYTFQAIGYLTEVYWEEEKAERRPIDFLLYMLLFMKFLSGPIERSADLLPQVRKLSPVSYSMMTYGLKLIVVGLVKKLVLADHIAPYIDGVFSSMHTASGVQLLMACLLYPIELYADFSGYTDMAIGIGMLFGLKLSPNFAHPFAAQTTAEFWRRWHISLSSWVRDYLFLPLSSFTRRWGVSQLKNVSCTLSSETSLVKCVTLLFVYLTVPMVSFVMLRSLRVQMEMSCNQVLTCWFVSTSLKNVRSRSEIRWPDVTETKGLSLVSSL